MQVKCLLVNIAFSLVVVRDASSVLKPNDVYCDCSGSEENQSRISMERLGARNIPAFVLSMLTLP